MFREICKHPQGILGPELKKKLHHMSCSNFHRLLKRLEEKKLIIKERRENPPYLTLIKPTPEGRKLCKQYLT